jgi:hypothetical protein
VTDFSSFALALDASAISFSADLDITCWKHIRNGIRTQVLYSLRRFLFVLLGRGFLLVGVDVLLVNLVLDLFLFQLSDLQ